MRDFTVDKVVQISDDIYELFVERNDFDFEVGHCVAIHSAGGVTSRPYSIASGIHDEFLSFLIKKIPNGPVSTYLCERKKGDMVTISDPYGWFKPGLHDNAVFISTGVGASPFLAGLRSNTVKPIKYYLGTSFYRDLEPYHHVLQQNGNLVLCITKDTNVPVPYYNGRVTRLLELDLRENMYAKDTHFYICGNDKLIEDCSAILAGFGYGSTYIHHECFFI